MSEDKCIEPRNGPKSLYTIEYVVLALTARGFEWPEKYNAA